MQEKGAHFFEAVNRMIFWALQAKFKHISQIFFERQCGPPKSTHYIFGQFYDAMDVDIGEKHLEVYLLEDIKVHCESIAFFP